MINKTSKLLSLVMFALVSFTNQAIGDPQVNIANTFDPLLAKKVKANLDQAGLRDAEISILAENGIVELSGVAGNSSEISRIEQIAKNTEGVNQIKNSMTVRAPATDSELTARINKTLTEEAISGVDDLKISAHDGTVSVSGNSTNHRDVDRLLTNIMMVDGVKDIKSSITINHQVYTR